MKIAIEGCCHGELDAIYSHISTLEQQNNYKVDLLLICGDFQAIRNERDLQCMAVPDKYKKLGEFHKYYTGEKKVPILTIVIGGNHEASNYFWELYHGGWLAPNLYFLGHAGCVQVNGIRIAGASGIFKPQDFHQGHWERLPYNAGAMRSIYHIREYNIRRLSLLSKPTIFLSHDWPQSIEHHGNLPNLLKRKPYFRQDIEKGALGSPPMMGLLNTLKPEWWFSAHLHCRFEATVIHHSDSSILPSQPTETSVGVSVEGTNPDEIVIDEDEGTGVDTEKVAATANTAEPASSSSTSAAIARNPEEITLDDEEEEVVAPPPPPPPAPQSSQPSETKFLALDKCLPRRQFLEVVDVPIPSDFNPPQTQTSSSPSSPSSSIKAILSFDPEWLAITRAFNPYLSTSRLQQTYPDEPTAREAVKRELEWVQANVLPKTAKVSAEGDHANAAADADGKGISMGVAIEDYQEFAMTAPGPGSEGSARKQQPPHYPNPQTAAFCSMLGIENKVDYTR